MLTSLASLPSPLLQAELTRAGAAVIATPTAPYTRGRAAARDIVERTGGPSGGTYFLVHVDTSLEYCEAHDRQGLYKAARAGEITGFTGVDAPYEKPVGKEVDLTVSLDTMTVPEVVHGASLLPASASPCARLTPPAPSLPSAPSQPSSSCSRRTVSSRTRLLPPSHTAPSPRTPTPQLCCRSLARSCASGRRRLPFRPGLDRREADLCPDLLHARW